VLLRMLEQHRWNVSNVAKALDVSRNTLYRKLHKLRIQITQRFGQ
jgi:sigma-54 dependent transcriptional regulator, acetoin dehydrogenase operon transcriptional activator AcoR